MLNVPCRPLVGFWKVLVGFEVSNAVLVER
jgi:hypothetical protein